MVAFPFLSSLQVFLCSSFPDIAELMVSGGVKVGDGSGGGSLGSERACRPLPPQPSSLTSCGIEEEYGFNRERELFFLKRGGGARGCLGWPEIQWGECLDVKKEVG